ncbi:hypothetical protein BDP27DRAFT_1323354 [Rhodocollybia butyracea]|uniref:Exoribonuclease phosphorolytic domain-containing protein n=1 Tax=Rhodocollybia butyracea TaxID=206335 RepID=A0A9P5U999_9AGAR|nr:hypothetical protein BDP27DRAFT_1323354 [Rhodocollybia butyracea]
MSLSLSLSFDALSRVDGSARFGFGLYPQFLTSLSGPIEVRLAAEQPSQTTIEVNVRPLTNVPGTESKKFGVILKEVMQRQVIMEANPRTLIQFVVQALVPLRSNSKHTLNSDEIMAAMINCCTLSLLNAGSVPMRGVICAVSVARVIQVDKAFKYVVQPGDPNQASSCVAVGCFAFLFSEPEPKLSSEPSSASSPCVWTNWRFLRPGHADSSSGDESETAARKIWERMKMLVEERENLKTAPALSLKNASSSRSKANEANDAMVVENEDEDDDVKMEI